jgi:glycosyltransferase involved in cell wall biosynthesis
LKSKIKILFVLPALHQGGSETVILHLVRNLDRLKFDVTLLVLKKEGALIDRLPSDIRVVFFNHARTAYALTSIFKMVWQLRPDVLFSTLGHLNLMIALLKPVLPSGLTLIARESSIVSIRNKDERYPRLFNFLFRTVYNRFHNIICQSEYMKTDLVDNFKINKKKIVVINNPIDFTAVPLLGKPHDHSDVTLLSVGNLRPEKGYDRVIGALEKCDVPFRYIIVGAGESAKLRMLAKQKGLDSKIDFAGHHTNPFPFYAQADCLLLGSYYEGFPNVVLEANACGLPVIAYRAPGGHNEIIKEGINGWFVDNGEELCQLIATKAYLKLNRETIVAMTRERYDLRGIIKQYEAILGLHT